MIARSVLLLATMLAACGPAPQVTAGFVIDVRSTSLTSIERFTLRTEDGSRIEFAVGPVELDGGAFPPGHLREHMALAQPLAVAYRDEAGRRVAYRLTDAPWLRP